MNNKSLSNSIFIGTAINREDNFSPFFSSYEFDENCYLSPCYDGWKEGTEGGREGGLYIPNLGGRFLQRKEIKKNRFPLPL